MAGRITHFNVGDVWVAEATFTVGGTPTDPTTLTVKQQAPDGTETVIANAVAPASLDPASTPVARTSTGVFRLNPGIALSTQGYWFVRFQGTGTAAATSDQQAIVDPSEFSSDAGVSTRALVTLAETKDWLNITQEDVTEDLDLVRLINDLSQRVIDESGREFRVSGTNPQTRTFPVDQLALYRRQVFIGDLAAAPTTVEIIDIDWTTVLDTLATSDYTTHPTVRQSWEPIRRLELHWTVRQLIPGMRIRVTGTFGFPTVPGNIRQAVLDTVAAARDRSVESYSQDLSAVGATNARGGAATTNLIVQPNRQYILSLPARAQAVIDSYRDPTIG